MAPSAPLPHGPLEALDDDLWHVEGDLPDMPLKRHMVVARRPDGTLVVHNGILLRDMGELDALGRVAWIVVPNGWHRLDAAAYKARYPAAKVVCPPGARKKVEQKVAVDAVYEEFPPELDVRFETLEGERGAEGVMVVARPGGVTLVFNDTVFNQPHLPGLFGFVYRLMGSSGGPKVPATTRLFSVKDRNALRAHLERLAVTPHLRRVVPGHGTLVTEYPEAFLRAVAATL